MTKHSTVDGFTSQRQRLAAVNRRERAVEAMTAFYLEADPDLTRAKAIERAEIVAAREGKKNPYYDACFLDTQPSLRVLPRSRTCPIAEVRAIGEHPLMAGMFKEMGIRAMGRRADRRLIVAKLRKMSFFGRPDFLNTYREFTCSDSLAWAYDFPRVPRAMSTNYDLLRSFTERMLPGMTVHTNLELLDEIAGRVDPDTGKKLHPNAFKRCSVDGTLIEADFSQVGPLGRSRRERKENERKITDDLTRMAQFVWYSKTSGSSPADGPIRAESMVKKCFGYKLVVICCLDLCLPIIWTLIPAGGDERTALREMIKALYQLRPDFPMEYLVGDGLYSKADELFDYLEPRHGITPVFPRIANRSNGKKWAKTDGVPTCKHGLMKRRGTQNTWRVRTRREHGVQPEQLPPRGAWNKAHTRWECPKKGKSRCGEKQTYYKWDRHLYTHLPHMGQSRSAALRSVLLARRNTSEAIFAQLKHTGAGAKWPNRARWATDNGMKWLTSLAMVQMTARRLVHLNGGYAQALDEARVLGYLNRADEKSFYSLLEREGLSTEAPEYGPPRKPSTWGIDANLPIDRKYRLPMLEEFDDTVDRD